MNTMRMMRTFCFGLTLLVTLCCGAALQAETKAWMRYPSISPDGKQIAFSYRGDLWLVSSEGGAARMLTSHAMYERSPIWSPDGKTIAFASDRHGNFDVFTISIDGGAATRVTYHSASDVPTSFTRDGERILFSSRRIDSSKSSNGNGRMGELYSIPAAGGRVRQELTTVAEGANFSPDSSLLLFHDYKGTEDTWRKHHTSSVTRDVWTLNPKTGEQRMLTTYEGENRTPVWSADGKTVYYLTEEGGTFNVWKMSHANPAEHEAITEHETHPVRFLSIANDDTMAYGFNGEIWVKPADGEPRKLEITAAADERSNAKRFDVKTSGAGGYAVSPSEEEIAFVLRGEIYVTSVEFGTTKRITDTPEQERSVSWGKDGRTLYYTGERNGSWNLYKSMITRDEEESFANATLLTEEPVLETEDETFQPVVSPDGKQLAYLKNRFELMVLDLKTKKSTTLIPARKNHSYTDGDISYSWSPDSRWMTSKYHGHQLWTPEVAVIKLATGEVTNVSESGYGDGLPKFSPDGKVLLYLSDRYGLRSHGGDGTTYDVFGLYLTQEAYDDAVLDKAALALKKKRAKKKKEADKKNEAKKKDDKKKDDDDKDDKDADEKDDKEKDVPKVKFEKDDLDQRLRRLSIMSSAIGSHDLSPDGETLIYTARVDKEWGLWVTQVRDRSTTKAMSLGGGGGQVQFSKDGKSAFLSSGGRLQKLAMAAALKGGKATGKAISFSADQTIDGVLEREYLFEHIWRQTARKFYDPKMHGIDWEAMKENYVAFLPTINNNHDFSELLSEMLGELNASHTGCRHYPRHKNADATAAFGLLYDDTHEGIGLKIAEVLKRGPVDKAESKIRAGHLITHINGEQLSPEKNPWKYLNRLAGKPVRLTLHDPKADKEWEEVIRPMGFGGMRNLMYERWIASRRALCEKLSGGRIGYVHVRGMGDDSFRRVFSEVLGLNNEKEALIVDTRFNTGGWLHEDLATFLSGETYCYFLPRDHKKGDLGGEPLNKWTRDVAVLQSEGNYSDAHFFPWAFKTKGIGKLIGSPVPGTSTAVWWEHQMDPTLIFGIPQVGIVTVDGKYLENWQLEPDVLVINDHASVAKGEDKQMAKAVEVMLKDLDAKKKAKK